MKRAAAWLAGIIAAFALASPAAAMVRGKAVHAITIHGEPKYGPDFKNFDYLNPGAPKGGTLVLGNANDHVFDTFNQFTLKGNVAQGLALINDPLMISGEDEPATNYCLICETIEVAPDNAWVEFKLRPQAKFNNGTPITADDVAFSFQILTTKGAPFYRVYWADVERAEVRTPTTVRFIFKTKDNPELASIIGQIPVLSKAYWSKRDFEATTLDNPVSNGPYTIDTFEIGRQITYKRNPNYWARDLPAMRGRYNFDRVRFEYYRDQTVQFEAFKRNEYDLFNERTAQQWATAYDFPAMKDGRVAKLEVVAHTPMEAQAFVLNLRRPQFQDRRVREALNLAFDFDALNRTRFSGLYTRVRSYFQRSELEPTGLPSPAEMALLEPLRAKIPPEIFTQEFQQPKTVNGGDLRTNLLKARTLLTQAGWEIKDGQLRKKGTSEPFVVEVLLNQPNMERIVLPWFQNLERLGIKGSIRVVETAQYANRVNSFDFDVFISSIYNSLSPGNEQAEFWSSAAADRPESFNYAGVKDAAVDTLISRLISAKGRDDLVTAAKALDRVLVANHYFILHYGPVPERYAYWTKLRHPERFPLAGMPSPGDSMISTWWMDPAAARQQAGK
jgi:microcin C transport system substrate-binding protein